MNELTSEGVTYIPPFESSKGRPRVLSTVEKQSSVERPEIDETIESEDEDTPEEPTLQPPLNESEQERIQEAAEPPPLQGRSMLLRLDFLFRNCWHLLEYLFILNHEANSPS